MIRIPKTKVAGDEELWRKQQELKNKLVNATNSAQYQTPSNERNKKKEKCPKLLAIIGVILGMLNAGIGPVGILITIISIIIIVGIVAAIRNKQFNKIIKYENKYYSCRKIGR